MMSENRLRHVLTDVEVKFESQKLLSITDPRSQINYRECNVKTFSGGKPPVKNSGISLSITSENAPLQDRRFVIFLLDDKQKTSICVSKLLCREDNIKMPNDENYNYTCLLDV